MDSPTFRFAEELHFGAGGTQQIIWPYTTRSHAFRPLLMILGILLAVLTIFYSAAWMYYIQRPSPVPEVEIGLDELYSSAGIEIQNVHPAFAGVFVVRHVVVLDLVVLAAVRRHRPDCANTERAITVTTKFILSSIA